MEFIKNVQIRGDLKPKYQEHQESLRFGKNTNTKGDKSSQTYFSSSHLFV